MENDTPRRMPNVPPFVKFVCANVPMVFDDSLSYYEALCALWKYVQGMTDVINNNATLEEEFIDKFNVLSGKFDDLKLWVETYFDNLDVQEEINNKLDVMAEDGTLADIIAEYLKLKGVLAYTNVQDLKEAENIVAGSMCETYGWYAQGDGGSAKYRIRNITNDDTVDDATIISITADPTNTLIAELIPEDEMNVKQFGVKGDGTTDDTGRLQIAFSFCSGKVIHFGNFTTGISEPLSATDLIIEGDNVTIKALAGFSGSSMLEPHNKISIKNAKFDANSVAICCIGESADNTYMDIEGCEFTGVARNVNASNFALNSAVYLSAIDGNVKDSNIHGNLSHGLRLMAQVAHTTACIDNCKFINNGSKAVGSETIAVGLAQYGGEQGTYYDKVSVTNCYASGNANTGIAPHSANNIVIDSCVSSGNGEHGICLMNGKNGIISNCVCDNNFNYGIRIQGDYSNPSSPYHGYKNCSISGCMTTGSGIDIDEYIDTIKISDNILTYYDTGTAESIKGMRIGRLDKPTHYVKNANIVNNYFYGFVNFPVQSFIPLDNSNTFLNYVGGVESKDYWRGSSAMKYNTCSLTKIGDTNNVLDYPTDLSHWTLVDGATLAGNTITRGTGNMIARYVQAIDSKPRFVSVYAEIDDYDEDAKLGIGFRFRDSSNNIIGSAYSMLYTAGKNYGMIMDLTKVGGLDPTNVAKIEPAIYLDKGSITINSCYVALSNELPILPNSVV